MSKILFGLVSVAAVAFSGGGQGFLALNQFAGLTPSLPAISEPATMILLGATLLAAFRGPKRA